MHQSNYGKDTRTPDLDYTLAWRRECTTSKEAMKTGHLAKAARVLYVQMTLAVKVIRMRIEELCR